MPPADLPPTSDRRRYHRYELWFPVTLVPVTLDIEGEPVWSICRDVSRSGILVASRQTVAPGTTLLLRFRILPSDADERIVHATVVRCEQNESELGLAFPWRLAIQFAEADESFAEALDRASTPPPVTT